MEKHILNLLNTNLRVIIPDFGAFIIRQKEPLVLVFNEFLRYNDGLLIDFIAKNENIEKEMARHQVAEFTENLVKALESGKDVKLEGIGTLRKAGDEKIEFIQAGKDIPKRAAKKVQEKKDVESSADEPVSQEEKTEASVKAKPPASPKTGQEKKEIAQPAKEEAGPEPVKASASETGKAEAKPSESKSASDDKDKRPGVKPEEVVRPRPVESAPLRQTVSGTPVAKPPASREKKNKKNQLIWIILIIIVVLLINVWFIFNSQIKSFFGAHNLSKPVPDTLGRIIDTDTAVEEAPVLTDSVSEFQELQEDDFYSEGSVEDKASVVVPAGSTISGGKKYYIVAGCFRDEVNADEMVKELKKKGYNAMKFGTIGNLHAVSYASFTDKEKALQEMERIRREVAPEAWMVQY
ncbi:MAG: SPOR domain-containing protein [Bacteroidales bacterium]|nr:SPOR domain-containing protein [Bacteroidales bacterium]